MKRAWGGYYLVELQYDTLQIDVGAAYAPTQFILVPPLARALQRMSCDSGALQGDKTQVKEPAPAALVLWPNNHARAPPTRSLRLPVRAFGRQSRDSKCSDLKD